MVSEGITNEQTLTVTQEMTAEALGSGKLPVFSTPRMISMIENTALRSVEPFLEEGEGTVGTLLNIRHTAPTPVGGRIICRTTLTEVSGRRLVFKAEVFDSEGPVGDGIHERCIINNAKFLKKAGERKL